jgi:hypothetical protein
MSGKRVAICARPTAPSDVDAWVRQGSDRNPAGSLPRADVYSARLTIDITPELRGRIKILAYQKRVTVAEMLRVLLEREFPVERGSDRT